jgi:mitogen-activated protein kinase 1/3
MNKYTHLDEYWSIVKKEYKLIHRLGKGSFGEVVRAQSIATNKACAIKYVKCDFKNIVQCRNILRELSILRQLKCEAENVFTIDLIDIKVHGDANSNDLKGIFLISDFIDNDLNKLMHSNLLENFSEDHIRVILYNILCSVKFIHSTGIMHRDIKPANILIDNMCRVKLCDFGLARQTVERTTGYDSASTASSNNEPTSTNKKTHKRRMSAHTQTRWYRSPEIILGEPHYD